MSTIYHTLVSNSCEGAITNMQALPAALSDYGAVDFQLYYSDDLKMHFMARLINNFEVSKLIYIDSLSCYASPGNKTKLLKNLWFNLRASSEFLVIPICTGAVVSRFSVVLASLGFRRFVRHHNERFQQPHTFGAGQWIYVPAALSLDDNRYVGPIISSEEILSHRRAEHAHQARMRARNERSREQPQSNDPFADIDEEC